MASGEYNVKVFELEPHKELRVEFKRFCEGINVELLDGVAEIFGVEMLKNKVNKFSSSFAVFTWVGCVLKLEGFGAKYRTVSKKSVIYDLHLHLEENRAKAQREGSLGPIVLVTGPTDVGKSTLTRNLLNYASRLGRQPIFIDLDVGQSSVSIPGTMCVLPIDGSADVVKGYNDQNLSVYFFGYKSPGFNILLYFDLIKKMSITLHNRMQNYSNIRSSGAIIDTCGWVTGQGYKSIIHAAESFRVTTVIVLDDKILYSKIKNDLPNSVDKIFIDKLDGVILRNRDVRRDRRANLISEYFFGLESTFKPFSFEVNYSEIDIVMIECSPSKSTENKYCNNDECLSLTKVPLSPKLLNQVLGISYADILNESVIVTSVLGFVYVEDINMEKNSIKILSPRDAPLPKKILIMGDIIFER